jgi:hypothetical protein
MVIGTLVLFFTVETFVKKEAAVTQAPGVKAQ